MTLPGSYFDGMYESSDDPWAFRSRWYEARKRDVSLSALPRAAYGSVFEPGCAIGSLTSGLAERSNRVLAMDVSEAALGFAAGVVPDHVTLVRGSVPDDWPDGHFDLTVVSEIGYYMDLGACQRLARLAVSSAAELLAVHWRHPVEDYPLDGDAVHRILAEAAERAGMARLVGHLETDFRLDVWAHDHRSVARRTGVPGS